MRPVSRKLRNLTFATCCVLSAFFGWGAGVMSATVELDDVPFFGSDSLFGFVAKDVLAFPQAIQCRTYEGAVAFGKTLAKFGTNIQASIAHEKYINQTDCFRKNEATAFYTEDLTGTELLSGNGESRIVLVTATELGVWSRVGYYLLVPLDVMDLVFGPKCNTPSYGSKVEIHIFQRSGPCWIDL